ncbi:LuxR C-terminal-related transcriptional regulator [Actinomycetospora cinnamomea]|uniref:LuxR family maltose regulon positive regulatory protein n=1 Tax=Actinomycetospora cinnamomea TaxID=663609 RepID=A0A2U1F3U2_9PSEU|nr:LuxR C-terminal-related transcriptional regulator [Actinomycetospora cinnamomea]PVZ06841.1 LuxR family maltose regulon positive regulatory protein [Actinomycetospora cinnamomea]
MVGPLLESKYRVPRPRPGTVARPRLVRALGGAVRTALTVVSAPAGFGKSTLLAEWLAEVPASTAAVACLALDERDDDPTVFWTYALTAMRAAAGVGDDALRLMGSTPASIDAALVAVLNDLGGMSQDLVLVLDDLHLVTSPAVHDGIAFLLEHRPPRLHLVLATRVDPPLPLARCRARGELLEARAADLRFTPQESAAYLYGPMGLSLSEHDVATLDGRAEGWIAALQLAALSMRGRDDVGAFIAGFAGDDRYVVDYLVEEVLARQPEDVRAFLLETSLLERLTGPLCDAVTGRGGSRTTLVALERANLFLVPLDDRRQWYRYHHLFADVLRAHLVDERPGTVPELHRRAGLWFAENGDTPAAVDHALAGGHVDRAADLMERAMPAMRRERRETELRRWVRSLPDEVVRVRPVLGMAFVGVLAQASAFDTVEQRLADVERSVRPGGGAWPSQAPPGLVVLDEEGYRSVPAGLEVYRAALALRSADLDAAAAHARRALALTPESDDLTRAAAGALGGLASWTRGDLVAAEAAYVEAIAGLHRAGSLADVLGCAVALGDIRRTLGRPGAAERLHRWALDLADPAAPVRGAADMHVALAGALIERDDLTTAAVHLEASRRLGEHRGLPQNPYRSRVVEARLLEARGDPDAALALLDEAEHLYEGDYSPEVAPVPAVRARLRLRRGELRHAEAWARQRQLSPDDDPSYLREYEHLTLARLLLARRDDAAAGLLARLRAAAEDGGRAGSVLEILVLQALVAQTRGDVPSALDALRRAVALAEPEGVVRVVADEGPPVAALLRALPKHDPAYAFGRRLLAACAGSTSAASTLVDPLSARELDVLRLLGSDLDGPDIARELSVSLNTVRTHTKSIYAKLGVGSRRAAVRRAHDLGVLPRRR